MINCMNKLLKDESGAAAIEYGMMAALIAVDIIAAVTKLGGSLKGAFEEVANQMSHQTTKPPVTRPVTPTSTEMPPRSRYNTGIGYGRT